MYADESGDPGLFRSPTDFFILSGITIHESRWRDFGNALLAYRRRMAATHGLPVRTELHASEYIQRPPVVGMSRNTRFLILRTMIDELAKLDFISVTSIVVDKRNKQPGFDVFDFAWKTLFQRFENTIKNGNFPGGHKDDMGMLFVDNTDGRKLTRLVRKMSAINYIPSMIPGFPPRNLPVVRVIEDPNLRDSSDSYMIQAADVCAYMLQQRQRPNSFFRSKGGRNTYNRLLPVLNTRASLKNPHGVVML